MEYSKLISDSNFEKYHGKHFSEYWYTNVISNSSDGYYIDEDGTKKVLFKFRKNVIPNGLQTLSIESFKEFSKKKHPNRGGASGIPTGQTNFRTYTDTGQNEAKYSSSNISGYYDRALREHRGMFPTQNVCRTTAFTLKNMDLWNKSLPFIRHCSKLFKKYSPVEYSKQKKEYSKIDNTVKIPGTCYTTITSNYSWRTACHKDTGDFPNGLGNLVVTGNSFEGGYLGFPQFKVLVKIKPGDFLLMDVHQWHCNTPIKVKGDGFRLSFVMYIRSSMKLCKKHKKIENMDYLSEK